MQWHHAIIWEDSRNQAERGGWSSFPTDLILLSLWTVSDQKTYHDMASIFDKYTGVELVYK